MKNLESLDLAKFQINTPEKVSGGRAPGGDDNNEPTAATTMNIVHVAGAHPNTNGGTYEQYD